MLSNQDIYNGNTASDYQPPTQNPQTATTNLQPISSSTQSTDTTNNNVTQQRLPNVDNLKVIVIQDGSGSTNVRLTPVQTATQTWIGPFWGCVVLVLVALSIWVVRMLAKEEAPPVTAANEPVIPEPLLASAPLVPTVTPRPKKKTSKKKKSKRK